MLEGMLSRMKVGLLLMLFLAPVLAACWYQSIVSAAEEQTYLPPLPMARLTPEPNKDPLPADAVADTDDLSAEY
jgi:hypothetical protein